jgi:hypothetical protein
VQPEMRDLLVEAKADPPPARYGVDDVLSAGRRRQRRRGAGWAIVAVVAVAAAIGVPQILTRWPAPTIEPAPPSLGSLVSFDYPFQGYVAGEYQVYDPTTVDISGAIAKVSRTDGDPYAFDGATLHVYRPGLDPLAAYPDPVITEADPIKGRRAFLIRPNRLPAAEHPELGWEYADGAVAILRPESGGMAPAAMRQVAEGFTRQPDRPVRLPFRVGHVPDGYRLIGVAAMGVLLLPADAAAERMAQPDRGPARSDQARPEPIVKINMDPAASTRTGATGCDAGGCYRTVDGDWQLAMSGSIEPAEMTRTLASITMADSPTPAGWLLVHDAVPASALLTTG